MPDVQQRLQTLAARWAQAQAAERANAQSYIIELCEALGVERPRPSGGGYQFEYPLRVVNRDGTETTNFVDLVKFECFLLEAKDEESGKSVDVLLRKAFGQARSYVANLPGAQPPYLMVLDVGKTLIVWDRWTGSYGGFSAGRVINLRTLHERDADIELLRDIWEQPAARDPRARAATVTEEIAATLAELASALERRGHNQEQVARYLIRVVFTMFAEDVGLLEGEPFRRAVDEVGLRGTAAEFSEALEELWAAMDEGRRFGLQKLLRFNGHFFKDRTTIPLSREDLTILRRAAEADWQHVEPTIFGTLLTRALDPRERHRLGAEYTPRAFIERVVRPTVEEPIRDRWTLVQAEVMQLRETGKARDRETAVQRLDAFHDWLRGLRFLDPACGSGNFLYVTLALVKQVELEVIRAREEVTGEHLLRIEEVNPAQFHGIEVKAWAREIAELTLWIGHHQFWRQHHDVQPPEPVLQDTGTLEHRDAVLLWDTVRHTPERDRPDPTPRLRHPVTGELVPDPDARLPHDEYVGARQAPWPEADFIVGNPPYLGGQRQRDVFGNGYVDALRCAYPGVPDAADYVMYWWHRAAEAVASKGTIRAGLITTNSITQTQNRAVIASAADRGARVTWAVPDHVWYDGADGAEVRVAMTVIAKDPPDARLVTVQKVERVRGDVPIISETRVPRLNADLTAHADVAGAVQHPLRANAGLSHRGMCLVGEGFVLEAAEAERLVVADPAYSEVVKPLRNGKDLTARPRGVYVIDFGVRTEVEAARFAVPFDLVRARVKPVRSANQRASYAQLWWRFAEPRPALRNAVAGLSRYIATSMTSKHRTFRFVPAQIVPDQGLVVVASDDAFVLGVLSSATHEAWALFSGGRMGVRHTPRYNNAVCFDPFPFPNACETGRTEISRVAMEIEAHRDAALARDPDVTLMKLYDVVAALRAGRPLSVAESRTYTAGACGILRDLHDELDRLVARAYGWGWPEPPTLVLERLVALHDVRVEDERRGEVGWLRPAYQAPRFGGQVAVQAPEELAFEATISEPAARPAWPTTVIEQIAALKAVAEAGPVSVEEAASRFVGARRELVARHLETLALMGELQQSPDGRYEALVVVA